MTTTLRRLLLIATLVAFTVPSFHSTYAEGSGSRRRATATPPASAAQRQYTPADKEFFMTEDGIAYIRPGLKIIVKSVTIGSDRKPVVELFLTDNMDQPLDR